LPPLPAPGRALRSYLLILALIFSAFFIAGTVAPKQFRQSGVDALQPLQEEYQSMGGGKLYFALLVRNVMVSIMIMVSGVLFGIVPVFSMASNGLLLGVVCRQRADATGIAKAALEVLPHGIIEIPALLIAASYGLWLGLTFIRRMRGRESTPIRFHIEHAFRRYFAIVFPLLIVAAAIETMLILKIG